MKLTLDTGVKKDLTDEKMATLDDKLHSRIPQLVGWCYSPLTGELTLDFGDVEDDVLLTKIANWLVEADGVAKKRFEILEMVKQWEE